MKQLVKETELYKKYRPTKFKQVVGQDEVCSMLSRMVKHNRVPHFILFTGPSGCGKTTLARILKRKLKCRKNDFSELNCADLRGVDNVRKIRNQIQALPLYGDCRIWLIDEAHKLTNEAQNALLKMLEDTPNHVYFMMATTDPHKLISTIQTRATEVAVKPLTESETELLIERISKKEKKTLPVKVQDAITLYADGSARKALVLLNQVLDMKNESKMIRLIEQCISKDASTSIAQALLKGTTWPDMADILKELVKEDAETLRRGIIAYAKVVMLNAAKSKAKASQCYLIIDCFRDSFFYTGHAGLAASCYEVIVGESK